MSDLTTRRAGQHTALQSGYTIAITDVLAILMAALNGAPDRDRVLVAYLILQVLRTERMKNG